MGIFKKLLGKKKSDADLRAEVLKKATEHWNANSEAAYSEEKTEVSIAKKSNPVYENIDKVKKKNIRAVLLEIAEKGEVGVLAISVSDKTRISQVDTATALAYLTKNNYVEEVNSPAGMKYFLTDAGKKYCISKEFNSEF